MQERGPAALTMGAGPQRLPTRCQLARRGLAPCLHQGFCRHCWLQVGKPPHLVLTIRLFLASAQRRPRWELGSKKRRRELPACCPLWAGTGRGQEAQGGGSRVHRSVVVGDFLCLVVGSCFSTEGTKCSVGSPGKSVQERPHSVQPLLLQTLLTPNKPSPHHFPCLSNNEKFLFPWLMHHPCHHFSLLLY